MGPWTHEGIVHELPRFPGRSKGWVALEILDTLDPDAPIGIH